jgi:GNAT superfamily N-acetyltransferase
MITFIQTNFSNEDFKKLIVELDKEFVVRYPFLQNTFTPFNLMNEHARVIIAHEHATPVACGAFRPVDDMTIEIKRMYTLPLYRNQGIGKRILMELEQWAKREGFLISKLETGINQPEAIAAYEKSGYVRIPKFPPYVYVTESICMEKGL